VTGPPTGRFLVVTGAGRGIGAAVAEAFGALGDHVVVASRTGTDLERVAAAVRAAGGEATPVAADVRDEAAVTGLMEAAAALTGRIDVVVCSAGVARVAPFLELSVADWEETVASTLTGTFLTCRAAVPPMEAGGRLVVLSSIAGRSGFPEWSAYSAAKFGVLGFAQAIRAELRPRKIRVTAVIPGAVDTSLWNDVPGEWNRESMLQPADVARAIVRLVEDPDYLSTDEVALGHIAGAL
jgi:NAD(P)-dependent dehydrogenase (short-subunit alcohol dehydrogenase family)